MAAEVTTAVTKIPCEKATARWEIHGFSRLRLQPVPTGAAPGSDQTHSTWLLRVADVEFRLKLYASQAGEGNERKINVGYEVRASESDVSYKKSISVWHKGREVNLQSDGHRISEIKKGQTLGFGWPNFARYSELCSWVRDDILTLQIHVEVWPTNGVQDVPSAAAAAVELGQVALSHDLGELLNEGLGTDVELCLKGAEPLRAHRLLLAARSAVFKSMLLSGFSESASNSKVQMLDAEPEAARCFVQYLYTDKVSPEIEVNDEMMCHLLALAHKYQVPSLVEFCTAGIAAKLSDENACERLMMADMLSVPRLKQLVLCFMTSSKEQSARVQSTDGYARLVQQRPHILADILAQSVNLVSKKRPPEPAALPADLGSLNIVALKRLLSDRGLPTGGNKQALLDRLQSQ